MSKEVKRSIETIPKMKTPELDYKKSITKLEDIMTEKPRASVKEIEATYRLIKMIDNQKIYAYSKKTRSVKINNRA